MEDYSEKQMGVKSSFTLIAVGQEKVDKDAAPSKLQTCSTKLLWLQAPNACWQPNVNTYQTSLVQICSDWHQWGKSSLKQAVENDISLREEWLQISDSLPNHSFPWNG